MLAEFSARGLAGTKLFDFVIAPSQEVGKYLTPPRHSFSTSTTLQSFFTFVYLFCLVSLSAT